jgi:conjugal transfer mating pair stabilization protein TraG
MYEFITIGGGEYFVDVFNGLAMLVKSGDFMDVVKLSAALAFMLAVLNAALMGSLYDSGKWFITTIIITQTLLYPKASVHVTDKTNPALQGAQIDNVPFVVAYIASASSQIGYSLTKQFELVYSVPDDLQYTQNGMIFGVNLMSAMSQARIGNANLSSSIDSFSQNCIFYDIQLNIYSFDDLKDSDDIWTFVKSNQVENRFFTYTSESGDVTYPTCKAGVQSLEADWNQEFFTLNKSLGFFAKKPDLTKAILESSAPLASEYFMNVSKSATQLLQQSMMINAISDATENQEAEYQVQLYQNARATAQAKSTYQTMGTQAGMWIPILKIVIEAVFYAAFPIIVLLCLIPTLTGPVLRGYFTTFFWLSSWGPIYAILHRISMGHAKTYTLGFSDGIGITLGNQFGLQQTMSDISAMAGYMSMFVPMLAYGIAKGGASAMSSMTTAFMSGVQGAVSTAAHEGGTGNLSFGNVGIGSRNVSSGVSITNDAGQVLHRHNNGSSSIDNSKAESNLGFNVHGSERVENAYSQQASNEQSLGQEKSMHASQSQSHGFERMLNNHRSIESSKGFEQNLSSEQKDSFSKINTAVSDFAKEHGITREKASEIFGNIGAGLSGSLGLSKKVGNGGLGNVDLNGEVGIGGRLSQRDSDQNHYKEALSYSKQHHLSKDFAVIKSAMESNRFNLTDSKGESINESFNKAASFSKEASQHFEAAKRYSDEARYTKSHSAEIDRNYNQELWGGLVAKYGTEEASKITNPGNMDKTVLNNEINSFMRDKFGEIDHVEKTNLSSEYNHNSANFKQSQQIQNESPYKFSKNDKSIDNSNLQNSSAKSFGDTKKIIHDAKIDNSAVGQNVIKKVKGEQDEGL